MESWTFINLTLETRRIHTFSRTRILAKSPFNVICN